MGRPEDDLGLTGWRAPARNRYLHGRLLGVDDFALEQEYVRVADAHLARAIGWGVVVGLGVTVAGAAEVVVAPGLALDGWGRRIVVPAARPVASVEAGLLVLSYRECATGVEPVPGEEDGEAARWEEGYDVSVRSGAGGAAGASPCPPAVAAALRAGTVDTALRRAAETAPVDPPADPSVVLGRLVAGAGGAVTVDDTSRMVAPTNEALLRLITCLVDEVATLRRELRARRA
jgi:hypothetical protein